MSLWLVGAGTMALDYVKVLDSLGRDYTVIGRGPAAAARCATATSRPVREGGVHKALACSPAPEQAIVAVGIEQLAVVSIALIEAGTRRLLVEKPGGLATSEIRALQQTAARRSASVVIAYNRRFYASTGRARELIAEDGGATTCAFEFTEWGHVVRPLGCAPGVKDAWFLANSTHVVDLAFHLCGCPSDWRAWRGGSLDWHPAAARFCGAGVTDRGVFFSYHADWEAPGRWGLEVLTRKRRFVFRPLEQLHVTPLGSTRLDRIDVDARLDEAFKPGLRKQTEAFLDGDDRFFCTVDDQLRHCAIYDEMAGHGQTILTTARL